MTPRRIALAALLAVLLSAPIAQALKSGQRAINFTLRDVHGKTVKLSALKGKVVLLDFWASWCAPCKKELPALDKLAAGYRGQDVVILTVNIDKNKANATKFLKKAKIKHLRVVLNPDGSVAGQYNLPTMPTSFVIDKRGIVRFVHDGYKPGDERKFKKEIDQLLKK